MSEENIIDTNHCQAVRGNVNLEEGSRHDSLAWLAWEQLQRGIVRGSSKMDTEEISYFTGMSYDYVKEIQKQGLARFTTLV